MWIHSNWQKKESSTKEGMETKKDEDIASLKDLYPAAAAAAADDDDDDDEFL